MNLARYLWEKLVVGAAKRVMRRHAASAGMAVITGDYVSLRAMLQGRFEDLQLSILEREVFPKLAARRLCLDIGANIGNHSVAFARSFDAVIAFEPNPRAFDVLQLNAKWVSAIRPVPLGASDRAFTAQAIVPAGNLGAAQITDAPAPSGFRAVAFECVRIDDFLDAQQQADVALIKVDVEGHELPALRGCDGLLRTARPVVVFELLRRDFDGSARQIWDYLQGLGYAHFYAVDKRMRRIDALQRRNYKMVVASPSAL